ncbi:MAG: TolC family protein [Kiritimatiellae bacterium]|nr:TolC family protein [Kiritimatiellia bacterium]
MRCNRSRYGVVCVWMGCVVLLFLAGCATRQPEVDWKRPPAFSDQPETQSVLRETKRPDGPLTIADAVRMAILSNVEVRSAEADLLVRERQVTTVKRLRRDPELRLSYGEAEGDAIRNRVTSTTRSYTVPVPLTVPASSSSTSSFEDDDRDGYEVALRVFPRNPWEQSARVSRAQAELHAAEAALSAAKTLVIVEVSRAFATLQFAEQDVMLAEALVDARLISADHARELEAQGQITLLDKAQALSRYLRALSDLSRSVETRDEARAMLAGLLRVTTDDIQVAWDGLPLAHASMENFSDEKLEEIGLAARADIAQLGWERVAVQASVKELKAAYIPWIGHVQASYGERSNSARRNSTGSELDPLEAVTTTSSDTLDIEGDQEEWEISAAMSLPVFSWWAQEHRVAQAEYEQACILEEQGMRQMCNDIRAARSRLASLAKQRKDFSDVASPVVGELKEIIRVGEKLDSLPPAEFARLREQVIETRRLTLQADKVRAMAELDLCVALGGANLWPDELFQIEGE